MEKIKKQKKVLSVCLASVLSFSLTACSSATSTTSTSSDKTFDFVKVTDYLFEATYQDYEDGFEIAKEYCDKYRPELGGCSSVQNGVIRGRNYDWTYDEEPEFVIHVPAAEGRHASVGVVATTAISSLDVEGTEFQNEINEFLEYFEEGEKISIDTEKTKEVYQMLPYVTLDGVNDAGLTVNINVVNYGEKGQFEMKTETTEDDLCPLMIPRLLLDNAGSIDECIEIIEQYDVYSMGTAEEAHFMISGPQSADDDTFNTVVIEFIPDENNHYQLSVLDYNKGDFVDNKAVMTNFHLTGYDGTEASLTDHPMGYERYQILMEDYDQGSTEMGMENLMKKVYYTRNYDLYKDNFWYSEYTSGDLTIADAQGLASNLMGDTSKAGPFKDAIDNATNIYNEGNRDAKRWHTVHCSIYNSEEKKLWVLPQEAGFSYEFELEQK